MKYRALNKARISDKLPIPIIEGLFDELCGSIIEKMSFQTHRGRCPFVIFWFLINH